MNEKLIFAVTLFRHGDRAPYSELKKKQVSYQWPNGIAQLTPKGMRQTYLLGTELRKRYIDKYHLLSAMYKKDTIYTLSTSYPRTIMSAQCCLTGLYPMGTGPKLADGSFAVPDGYQPIPIYTIGKNKHNIINPENSDNNEYHRLLDTESKIQPDWIQKDKELAEDYKKWSEIFGVKINNLYDILLPGDTVFCLSEHGLPMPKDLTSEDIGKIIDAYLYVCLTRTAPKTFTRFMAHGFVKKLCSDILAATNGTQKYKYMLYSGHDISIVSIMYALGATPKFNPPYASHLDFELYKQENNYYIKVFLNGDTVKFPIDDNQGSYKFESFLNLYKYTRSN